MSIPAELLALYKAASRKDIFYIKMRWNISPVRIIEEALPKSGRIYDIGCGAGLLSNLAALRSGERYVTGIDISEEKIAIAVDSIGDRKNISFMAGDSLDMKFDRPDAVVVSDVLHHISYERQGQLLRDIYRSLSSEGVFLLQDIDKRPFYKYIFALGVDKALNWGERFFYRDGEAWRGILENIGFDIKQRSVDKGYPIAAVMFECRKRRSQKKGFSI